MAILNRRRFLRGTSLVGLGVGAIPLLGSPIGNSNETSAVPIGDAHSNLTDSALQDKLRSLQGSQIRLALAAYSFREHFAFMKGKPQEPQEPRDGDAMDMFSFVDYCAKHQCAAELTSYFFPPDADDAYFLKLKRHAFLAGVPIVGTAIGNNFTVGIGDRLDREIADAKSWIDQAAVLGAPHVRFFAGTRKQLEAAPDNMKIAIESLQQCADYAASKGIFVGVENHGQLTVEQVLEIVAGVESDWFGINLDTGNFISDTPYEDLKKCAPHAVNVQLKLVTKSPAGETQAVDLAKIKDLLESASYRGYVVVEYEETKPFEEVPKFIDEVREAFGV